MATASPEVEFSLPSPDDEKNAKGKRKRVQAANDDSKRYPCEWPDCDKSFTRQDHLARHKLNHEPAQIYTCERCSKVFVRADLLVRHVERHERREQVKAGAPPAPHAHKPKGASTILRASKPASASSSSNTNAIASTSTSQPPDHATAWHSDFSAGGSRSPSVGVASLAAGQGSRVAFAPDGAPHGQGRVAFASGSIFASSGPGPGDDFQTGAGGDYPTMRLADLSSGVGGGVGTSKLRTSVGGVGGAGDAFSLTSAGPGVSAAPFSQHPQLFSSSLVIPSFDSGSGVVNHSPFSRGNDPALVQSPSHHDHPSPAHHLPSSTTLASGNSWDTGADDFGTDHAAPTPNSHAFEHDPHLTFLQSTVNAPFSSAQDYQWLFDTDGDIVFPLSASRPASPGQVFPQQHGTGGTNGTGSPGSSHENGMLPWDAFAKEFAANEARNNTSSSHGNTPGSTGFTPGSTTGGAMAPPTTTTGHASSSSQSQAPNGRVIGPDVEGLIGSGKVHHSPHNFPLSGSNNGLSPSSSAASKGLTPGSGMTGGMGNGMSPGEQAMTDMFNFGALVGDAGGVTNSEALLRAHGTQHTPQQLAELERAIAGGYQSTMPTAAGGQGRVETPTQGGVMSGLLKDDMSIAVDRETRARIINFLASDNPGLDSDHRMSCGRLSSYLYLFWTRIHQTQVPALHRASFKTADTPAPLLIAMMLLGCFYAERESHDLAVRLHSGFRGKVFCSADFKPRAELWVSQTALLTIVFGKLCSNRMAHEMAHIFWGSVVTLSRRSALFSQKRVDVPEESRNDPNALWLAWVEEESAKRIAHVLFMIDVEHAALFRHSPTLSAFQIQLTLPCEEDEWEAPDAQSWLEIHQRQRPSLPFISALKASLMPDAPTPALNPFSKIMILHGLMSVSQDLQWRDHVIGMATQEGRSRRDWRDMISASYNAWKARVDACLLTASQRTNQLLRASVSLYAVAHITLSIDIHELQIWAGAESALGLMVSPEVYQATAQRIKVWASSKDGRAATWHAAHFLRSSLQHHFHSASDLSTSLHHKWSVLIAALALYAYGTATSGRPGGREPDCQEACMRYLDSMCTLSPEGLVAVPGKNNMLCVIETIYKLSKGSRWEIAQEGARILARIVGK